MEDKIPDQFHTNLFCHFRTEPSLEPRVSTEEKKMHIIHKNREALEKKEMLFNNMLVDIDESADEGLPHYNPPNACQVLYEQLFNQKQVMTLLSAKKEASKQAFPYNNTRNSVESFSKDPLFSICQKID